MMTVSSEASAGRANAPVETFRGVVFPWHCDSMGHMSVQHQMPLLDSAVYHLLGRLGPITCFEDGRRVGWADVSHDIRYAAELVTGDLVVLHSSIVHIGRTSLRHRTRLARCSDGQVCTILEGVTVRFDLEARRPLPLSAGVRAAAEALLEADAGSSAKGN